VQIMRDVTTTFVRLASSSTNSTVVSPDSIIGWQVVSSPNEPATRQAGGHKM
jgi:hypothetical protein